MATWIVTGGAGFIGCNFVRLALATTAVRVVVADKLTYAGNRASLSDVAADPRMVLVEMDIADRTAVAELFRRHRPEAVVNFAAESHVDRSIDDPSAFVRSNTVGVFELLEGARRHLAEVPAEERQRFRFLHVSTDEVYGSLGPDGAFSEETPYAPNSPYAASKAAADHLARAWWHTYRLPVLVTNCSNNYGPYQYPEKLIPLTILNALEGKDLPIYGDGRNVRDWVYVEDHCQGVLAALTRGRPGERYNLGGECERTNLEIVDAICDALERLRPAAVNPALARRGLASYRQLKRHVPDRPGHDRRYAMDIRKAKAELDWRPRHGFADGIERTVAWYLERPDWCEAVQSERYRRERLGLAASVTSDPAGGPA
jgi:dTDP-glucose 4,6-dehydratase